MAIVDLSEDSSSSISLAERLSDHLNSNIPKHKIVVVTTKAETLRSTNSNIRAVAGATLAHMKKIVSACHVSMIVSADDQLVGIAREIASAASSSGTPILFNENVPIHNQVCTPCRGGEPIDGELARDPSALATLITAIHGNWDAYKNAQLANARTRDAAMIAHILSGSA
jgi:hypothetical protein